MNCDPQIDSLSRRCAGQLPATLEFLRRMVEMNSFTENAEGVDRLGDVIAEQFVELGFEAARFAAANPRYGHHLVLKRAFVPGAPTIALLSHLDTVYTEEEEQRNDFG